LSKTRLADSIARSSLALWVALVCCLRTPSTVPWVSGLTILLVFPSLLALTRTKRVDFPRPIRLLALFFCYCGLSALWSEVPATPLRMPFMAVFFVVLSVALRLKASREGFVIGLGVSVLINLALLAGDFQTWIGSEVWISRRFTGTFNNSNFSGTIFALFALVLFSRAMLYRNLQVRLAFGGLVLILSGLLVLNTGSRRSAVLFLIGLMVLTRPKSTTKAVAFYLIAGLFAAVVVMLTIAQSDVLAEQSVLFTRIHSTVDDINTTAGSYGHRMALIISAIDGWLLRPIFGHGWGAFEAEFDVYAHNGYVHLAYDVGLLGTLMYYGVVLDCFRHASQCSDPKKKNLIGAVASVLLIADLATVTAAQKEVWMIVLLCLRYKCSHDGK
jgi:hypothetical protein